MSGLTIWQENAEIHATRQPDAIDAQRHAGIRDAIAHLRDGNPGRALYTLVRSVERQARIAGAGTHEVHPGCPCGGRCERGQAVRR